MDTDRLRRFFDVKERGLPSVLRDLNIRPIGGRVQPPALWQALGLSPVQDPAHWSDLTEPLMTAKRVAEFCGVTPRTIHRWAKGENLPADMPPMPSPVPLGGTRKLRWRKAEIRAWQNHQPQPAYAKAPPQLGALRSVK